jgi:hypothetical protein
MNQLEVLDAQVVSEGRRSAAGVPHLFRELGQRHDRGGPVCRPGAARSQGPLDRGSGCLFPRCGWSRFEGQVFHDRVLRTWQNGRSVHADGRVDRSVCGERLRSDR